MSSEKLTIAIAIATLQASLTRFHHHAHRRPWTELLHRNAISMPESLTVAFSRVRKNVRYFGANYLIVMALILATSLLYRPLTLLLIASLAGAWLLFYFRKSPEKQLVVFGRAFSEREVLIALVVTTVAVVVLTSVVSVIATAVTVAIGVVCAHGAIRVPEDLFLEQEEPWPWSFGFLPSVETGSKSLGVRIAV